MQFLFQQSYNQGCVPEDWNKAIVTAIHKKGPKRDPGNYRPISLTCLVCKVMEHVELSHMAKHLAAYNILLDSQHGFREKLSTQTQLITSVHDWATTLNNRGQCDLVLLDFSKAFDMVPHRRLAVKLDYYGIRGPTLRWIVSFLSNRQQAVAVNGSLSSWEQVTSGVPQGSVLGPALFLLYINGINQHLQSDIRLFADDSIIYKEITSPSDHNVLQKDLESLATWSNTWLMSFNVKKCAIMSVTLKKKPSLFSYTIHGEELHRVSQHDYLGVTISNDLNWSKHCQKTAAKASRTLGMLRRTLSACSADVKARSYLSLVRPQLEYGSEAWNPHANNDVKRLENIQRQATRFVFQDFRRTTSVTPLIQQLQWDSLQTRRLLNQSVMFYKIQHQLINISFSPHFQHVSSSIRRNNSLCYQQPNSNVDVYAYSFYPRTIRIWNRLPEAVVCAPSICAFKPIALNAISAMSPQASLRTL